MTIEPACDGFKDTAYGLLDQSIDQAPPHVDDCNRCGNRACIRLAHLYAYVQRKRRAIGIAQCTAEA